MTDRPTVDLAALREAIDQELEGLPPESQMDQFEMGAAAAYSYVLSHWPTGQSYDIWCDGSGSSAGGAGLREGAEAVAHLRHIMDALDDGDEEVARSAVALAMMWVQKLAALVAANKEGLRLCRSANPYATDSGCILPPGHERIAGNGHYFWPDSLIQRLALAADKDKTHD